MCKVILVVFLVLASVLTITQRGRHNPYPIPKQPVQLQLLLVVNSLSKWSCPVH